MKKLVKLLCVILISLIVFTGCSNQGLSNRAIVKTILIDVQDNNYKVSLVMLNCEPSSQIAEIKETASIFTGESSNLSTAILNAEKKQNKSAFYAQNELLFINLKALDKFDEIVNYFLSDNFARPGMTVYLTEATEGDLKETEKGLPKLINGVQNINIMNNPFIETRIYDTVLNDNSYSAIFPILKIDAKDGSYNVNDMGVVVKNGLSVRLEDSDMAMTILLSKRSDFLTVSCEDFNFYANSIKLSNEVVNGELVCFITGNIKQADFVQSNNNQSKEDLEKEINNYVSIKCSNIYNNYLKEGNLLRYNWWFKMYGYDEQLNVRYVSKMVI